MGEPNRIQVDIHPRCHLRSIGLSLLMISRYPEERNRAELFGQYRLSFGFGLTTLLSLFVDRGRCDCFGDLGGLARGFLALLDMLVLTLLLGANVAF